MKVTDKDYYMDGYLVQNLNHLKKAVKKGWDGFIMVDGIEGSAKTTLTAACSYYLDNNYNLDNVVFSPEQFNNAVDHAIPGSVIHWDEFVMGGLSTEALNKMQNILVKKMTTMRKKQLYVFLVVPWFFMMRPYFSVARSRALIHCYTPDGISRGTFRFYSYVTKKRLYFNGKKFYNYSTQNADFYGRFTDTFGLFWDKEEYDKKKEIAIRSIGNTEEKVTPQKEKALVNILNTFRDIYSIRELADIANVPRATLHNWLPVRCPDK